MTDKIIYHDEKGYYLIKNEWGSASRICITEERALSLMKEPKWHLVDHTLIDEDD